MAGNTSDFILQRISEWGIKRIYGYPGDGINGLIGALDRNKDIIEFIQVRHEEMSAFMAGAHAKFTGEVGVCMATSGPGAIHLLNGLYDAKMDHQPVVAIVGQQRRAALGGQYQQEVDLISLFKDVAHQYVHMASDPMQIRHLIDQAIRVAKAERTVTCVIIPNDIQEMDAVTKPSRTHGTVHSGTGLASPRVIPRDSDLQKAAEILNQGKKVAMLVGAGALGASEEVKQTAQVLGAGVAKALLGKTVLDDDLPFVTGAIGLLGTRPSYKLMTDCDTLLMIGTSFPYSEWLPKEGKARGIQIDIDGKKLGMRYPTELNLIGDSQETLQALLPLLKQKEDRSWQEDIADDNKDWWKVLERRAMNSANPINPQRIFWELSPLLPDDVILSADSGSAANWFARDLKVRSTMMASLSGNLASMGPGVPYAIAAKFAFPQRPVIAMVGDGAMQMNGLNELITIKKYWQQWHDPRLIILVLNNNDLNQVTWEQRVLSGDPKFDGSQELPEFNYAEFAQSIGLRGIRMETPDDILPGWQDALNTDRPVIVDALVDPNVPPLPPHIRFDQAKAYLKALFKGDPEEFGIIKQTFKDTLESYLPK